MSSSRMLRINGSIKKRSDKEIKDLIAPQGGVGDFVINAPDSGVNIDLSQLQRTNTKWMQLSSKTFDNV